MLSSTQPKVEFPWKCAEAGFSPQRQKEEKTNFKEIKHNKTNSEK